MPSGSLAAACFAVRAVTDPAIPNNGGCFRPITLTLPEGSIVNPREPAPVNARTATIKRITNTMLMALAEVAPERIPAPNSGELLVMAWGGQRRDGRSFVTGELLAGGAGARQRLRRRRRDRDRRHQLHEPARRGDGARRADPRPTLAARAGLGGAGQFRGGLGQLKEYEILDDVAGAMSYSHRGERHFTAAAGLQGGGAGAWPARRSPGATAGEEVIPSKIVTGLAPGDRVVISTAGGGGYGPPAAREPMPSRAMLPTARSAWRRPDRSTGSRLVQKGRVAPLSMIALAPGLVYGRRTSTGVRAADGATSHDRQAHPECLAQAGRSDGPAACGRRTRAVPLC